MTLPPSPRVTGARPSARAVMIVDVRNAQIRLDLSPPQSTDLLRTLEACLDGGMPGPAQLRLGRDDLNAIYLYLGPAQTKSMVARLKALQLSAPKQRRTR